ncbi:MAG: Rieske 2Fe-2S domain-containing protein [Acidimicrobiales bacterium]
MAAPEDDDGIWDEWFPVCPVAEVAPGEMHPFDLLGERWFLALASDGRTLVARDTCPHRGAKLSQGRFEAGEIMCGYHGWRYGMDGRCTAIPAQPDAPLAGNDRVRLARARLQEAYGLYWVCLGDDPRELVRFPEWAVEPSRDTVCGSRVVDATGPRIVENFLDLAHLPFVHPETLGVSTHATIGPYDVSTSTGEIVATNCEVWQPAPGPGTPPGTVHYTYRVSAPYTATLEKLPGGDLGAFGLLLVIRPEDEARCRCWMVGADYGSDTPLSTFNEFNMAIFDQDRPVVEGQLPQRLALDLRAELHCPADRTSLAYRRWLRDRGIRYGTSDNDAERAPVRSGAGSAPRLATATP